MKRYIILFISSMPLWGQAQTQFPDSILKILNKRTLDTTQVDRLNNYATSYLKENPALARDLVTALLDHSASIYQGGRARSLTILGNTYWSEGAYELALRHYLLSARTYENLNDSLGLGRTYNNIGEVYKKINEYEKSLDYLLASLSLKKNKAPISLYNVGELYLFMNEDNKAGKYFQESLAVAIDIEDNRAIAYCYWGLGKLKAKEKNYDQAIALFSQSLHTWQALGEVRSIIQLHQEIGLVFNIQKKFADAKVSLEKAEELALTINVPDLKLKNYFLAYAIDSAQGNLANALQALRQYNLLKDSVYNLQKAEQISRLQTVYETEVRAREYKDLRYQQTLDNAQLKNQRIIIFVISLGLLLTSIMAIFLYRQQKQILLSNKELGDKNEKIIIQNDAIQRQAIELKKLNQELTDLNKNLESRIQERTQQLYLQNQKLTDYLFVNAHKLRAPIATILGLVNLIERLKPDEITEAISHLKNCGEQLDRVIHDLSTDLEGGIIDN